MPQEQTPNPNVHEFKMEPITHREAVRHLSHIITEAALGNEHGVGTTPVIRERHQGRVDEATVGDLNTLFTTARSSDALAKHGEHSRSLEIGQKAGGKSSFREIVVDPGTGAAHEIRYKNGERVVSAKPSTRRLMAASRLARHQFGLKRKEKAA